MNFPMWDVPMLGGGMLIGIIAIVHVFVSHFAIGGGLYLVLTERKARQENDDALLRFTRQHSTFFILVILVFGAVTGAGIWWTIGLVHPTATSSLIHTFVWVWAIEWVFFLVELLAAFVYYYGWDKMDPATHLKVGWIYVAGAWLSLLMINGILTFMLTSGKWTETHSVFDAWFNPTMLPSLVMRTAVCVALAGLYALITASLLSDARLKDKAVKYSAKWVLAGCAVIPIGGLWYAAMLPAASRELTMGGAPVVSIFTLAGVAFSVMVVGATLFGPYLLPRQFHITSAIVLAVFGLLATGMTEMVREAVRKPYVIGDYMYSNAILKHQIPDITQAGILQSAKWSLITPEERSNPLKVGERVFQLECQSCHTVEGFNGIKFAVNGWNRQFLDTQLQNLNTLKPFMPPFAGTDEERAALVEWLMSLNQQPSPVALATTTTEGGR